jgi:hypothetical protein
MTVWRRLEAGMVALAAMAALIGCGATTGSPEAVAVDADARNKASRYVRGTVKDVYRSIRKGKADTNQTLLADDLFAVGPHADQLYQDRTAAVLAITSAFELGKRLRLRSRGLVAEAAATGSSAWVVDRIDVKRRRYTVVAVLAEVDEIWYVVALQVGATRGGDAAELPPLPGGAGGADEVVDLVRAGAAAPTAFLDQLSEHKKVTVVGPGKSDHLRGSKRIAKKWTHKRKPKAPAPFDLIGEVRAGVTPDGGVAWVVANSRETGADEAPLHRRMFVYQRVDDAWRLVVMQDAIPPSG